VYRASSAYIVAGSVRGDMSTEAETFSMGLNEGVSVGDVFIAVGFGALSSVSCVLGAAFGICKLPSARIRATMMAFGAGALIEAVALELFVPILEHAVGHREEVPSTSTGPADSADSATTSVASSAPLGIIGTTKRPHLRRLSSAEGGDKIIILIGILLAIIGAFFFTFLNKILNDRGAFLRKSATFHTYMLNLRRNFKTHLILRLRQVPMFAHLPEKSLHMMLELMEKRSFAKGEIVFEEMTPNSSIYFILQGSVHLSVRDYIDVEEGLDKSSADCLEIDQFTLGPDDVFGEMSLFLGRPVRAQAIAMTATKVLILPGEALHKFMEQEPSLREFLSMMASERLLETDVFREASPSTIARLVTLMSPVSFDAGDVIFHDIDAFCDISLIVLGSVRIDYGSKSSPMLYSEEVEAGHVGLAPEDVNPVVPPMSVPPSDGEALWPANGVFLDSSNPAVSATVTSVSQAHNDATATHPIGDDVVSSSFPPQSAILLENSLMGTDHLMTGISHHAVCTALEKTTVLSIPRARLNTLMDLDKNLKNAIIASGAKGHRKSLISYTVGTDSRKAVLRVRKNDMIRAKVGYPSLQTLQWNKIVNDNKSSSFSLTSPRSLGSSAASRSLTPSASPIAISSPQRPQPAVSVVALEANAGPDVVPLEPRADLIRGLTITSTPSQMIGSTTRADDDDGRIHSTSSLEERRDVTRVTANSVPESRIPTTVLSERTRGNTDDVLSIIGDPRQDVTFMMVSPDSSRGPTTVGGTANMMYYPRLQQSVLSTLHPTQIRPITQVMVGEGPMTPCMNHVCPQTTTGAGSTVDTPHRDEQQEGGAHHDVVEVERRRKHSGCAVTTSAHENTGGHKLPSRKVPVHVELGKYMHEDTSVRFISQLDAQDILETKSKATILDASSKHAATMIWLGMLIDAVPESIVIGILINTGSMSSWIAFIVGVFLSNFPEAMSSSGTLKIHGVPRQRIMLMWTLIVVLTGIGAGIGALLFPPGSEENRSSKRAQAGIEGLCGGAMLAMISNTALPEAFEQGGDVVGVSTTSGFLSAFLVKALLAGE